MLFKLNHNYHLYILYNKNIIIYNKLKVVNKFIAKL